MTRIWYKVIKNVSQIYNIEVKAKTNLLILKKLKNEVREIYNGNSHYLPFKRTNRVR